MHNDNTNVLDCPIETVKYSSFSERLRPRTIDELLIPDESIAKFKAMIQSRNVMNMIFYGSPGTGKTTCANLIGKSDNMEMLKLNAALFTGIDDIRKKVENYATSISLFGDKKIVLLDESDHLSSNAQASLRGLIEESMSNCRFILTANQLRKIHEPLQSRCRPFCFDVQFSRQDTSILKLTKTIQSRLKEMNIQIDQSIIHQIVVMKFPDYRAIANEIEFEVM